MYLGYLPFAYGCNIGMRRSTFLELGGFEEDFLRGDEDVDLSWRAVEHDVEMYVASGAIVDFRLRPTLAGVRHQRHNYQRSQVDTWARSKRIGRPVSGMSLRWTLTRAAMLPVKQARMMGATEAEKYAFASYAGDIMGNLHGQWEQRVRPLLVDRFSLISHRGRR
jgi:hypothetical protein